MLRIGSRESFIKKSPSVQRNDTAADGEIRRFPIPSAKSADRRRTPAVQCFKKRSLCQNARKNRLIIQDAPNDCFRFFILRTGLKPQRPLADGRKHLIDRQDRTDPLRHFKSFNTGTGKDQRSVTIFVRLGGYSGESTGEAWFKDVRLYKVDGVPGGYSASLWTKSESSSSAKSEKSSGEGTASLLLVISSIAYFALFVLLCATLLLSGVLGSARMVLKRHDVLQVVAGFLNGYICVTLAMKLFD